MGFRTEQTSFLEKRYHRDSDVSAVTRGVFVRGRPYAKPRGSNEPPGQPPGEISIDMRQERRTISSTQASRSL